MIYLDNGATTRPYDEAVETIVKYTRDNYGNAMSSYSFGRESQSALETARMDIASLINCNPREVFFTSGGTESNNWVLNFLKPGDHLITSAIEHPSIMKTCQVLEKSGIAVTYVPVDEYGVVSPEDIEKEIKDNTKLISVMTANNEVGTIEPIEAIGRVTRDHNILFHSDGVQAVGHINVDVSRMGVHYLSGSAHKFGGPKGVGFLYMNKGKELPSFMNGGGQEGKYRAGTHNTGGIAAMGVAAKISLETLDSRREYEENLRDNFINKIKKAIPDVRVNGHLTDRLPGNISLTFDNLSSETVLIMLDMEGICASAGSACSSGAIYPSHVLKALGLSDNQALSSLRLTLSHRNTPEEMDLVIEKLKNIKNVVDKRRMRH